MLQNAIDMHIHAAPDVIARSNTDIGTAKEAAVALMRGIMLKNHVTPTYARAALAEEAVPGIKVYGGLVLNAACGGLNPDAVAAALKMNAHCIWLPTSSSVQHQNYFPQHKSTPVPVFLDGGNPAPHLEDILDMIGQADCILATGHLHPDESELLVPLAKKHGIRKIVITHPEFCATAMPIEQQKRLARQDVFFERCFYASNSPQQLPVEEIAKQINAVGWQTTILASDFGQVDNQPPVDGLRRFLLELSMFGIPENHLRAAITEHPASLLD